MAKPSALWPLTHKSSLVLEGDTVKLRVEAERLETGCPVHVDWFRFTVVRRNCPEIGVDFLFPLPVPRLEAFNHGAIYDNRAERIAAAIRALPSDDFDASVQALELANRAAAALGPEVTVCLEPKKGMDFYKYRYALELNGSECGWVGFLASSESPGQGQQSKTIHVNIFGAACTFAASGWRDRLADLVDDVDGVVTRCDLALDFFDGLGGGIQDLRLEYRAGLCDVGGRRLKFNMVGDWENGNNRSFYVGSRESGKITNVYEKGDQLYGEKSNSEWLRIELRYGNKLRVLSADMLRRPADFFAGASDWHESLTLRAASQAVAAKVSTTPRLAIETVKAECTRSIRWLRNTASAAVAVAFEYLEFEQFIDLVSTRKLPGRLSKFSRSEIAAQLGVVFGVGSAVSLTGEKVFSDLSGSVFDFVAVERSPAFA